MDSLKKINSLFEWLKEITYYKTPINMIDEESWKFFELYMINRFLSMNKDYIELVNTIQRIPYDNKKQYYLIYCNLLPKVQNQFFRYKKPIKTKYNQELLLLLNSYFKCSTRETLLYLQILSKDDITEIIKMYGKEDKEIKKLLKVNE